MSRVIDLGHQHMVDPAPISWGSLEPSYKGFGILQQSISLSTPIGIINIVKNPRL
jgi:hypothetical protein